MSAAARYPDPPNKPAEYECCKRGCCPCIFDYYWNALDRWQTIIRELGGDPERVLAEKGRFVSRSGSSEEAYTAGEVETSCQEPSEPQS